MYSVIMYVQIDGIPTFRDSDIMGFYDKMVSEDISQTVFISEPGMSREKFLAIVKSDQTIFYVVEDDKEETAAIVWLNRFESKVARLHFCVFKKFWGRGADVMTYVAHYIKGLRNKDGSPLFTRLIGYVPSENKPAIRCAIRGGGTICGEIPDYFWDYKNNRAIGATIAYL